MKQKLWLLSEKQRIISKLRLFLLRQFFGFNKKTRTKTQRERKMFTLIDDFSSTLELGFG